MRNKILITMAAAGMVCGTSAFADTIPNADAGSGTISFSGSVIEAPCSIVPQSQNIQVNLGQVSVKSLTAADKYSGAVPFSIDLTGCSFDTPPASGGTGTNYSKVAVDFTGSGLTSPTGGSLTKGEIANTASDNPAGHVAIQLLKSDASTPVDLSKAPTAGDIALDTSSTTSQLKFYARMYTLGEAATSGNVGATITYKLKYF
ncbi:long polar fimbrial protein LpfA [Salmonella enterica]|nr:long polar fimbrial protein LpfA [Salmonella enterica]